MPFTLFDRIRSRVQRHVAWKSSSKARPHQNHVERNSEDSDASEFTVISPKTSIDSTASMSSASTSLYTDSQDSASSISQNHVDPLRTSFSQPPKEAVGISALLDLKRQKLLELEQRMEALDRQREILDHQRALLDEEVGETVDAIDIYRGEVECSVRRMPMDLLLEIFQHYLADNQCSSSLGSATVLTHVCRTWRQVALSSPSLWTSISAPRVTERVVANVKTRLSQVEDATGLPLHFNVTLRKGHEAVPEAEFGQLSSELLRASATQLHRWKSFALDCGEASLFVDEQPFDIAESMVASRLETLELVFPGTLSEERHPVLQWTFSLIHSSPALRQLTLQLPGPAFQTLSRSSLPLLESLSIEVPTVTPTALLELLQNAVPKLRTLELRTAGFVSDDEDVSSIPFVEHSSLETFKLRVSHGENGDAISQFLDNLALPSCREILYEMGHFNNLVVTAAEEIREDLDLSWPHESFLGLLERAASNLSSLSLGFNSSPMDSLDMGALGGMGSIGTELEEEHVLAYLNLENVADTLRTLQVKRDRPVWPGLLEYLTLPSSSVFRRPSMSSIRSVGSRSSRVSHEALRKLENVALDIDPIFQVDSMRKFVKSRWYDGPTSSHSFSRLRSFIITLCFPDLPNLDIESSATRRVFERIARTPEGEKAEKLDVVFLKRTYSMMPMDIPMLPLGSDLTI
ncbi:hypothetical protein D9757_003793 [Collybiopsis confluens]|uniref:F-box domain-containing protein n=1 Tax=Collybiopsis confluens TaxID=2823264 RepID=A0A8H5MDM8_9AGAR|nr:hypothetical protein D9757_003793 [Collybiopsis confluens]